MFDNTTITNTNDDSGDPETAMHETHQPALHIGHSRNFDVRAVAIAVLGWILPGLGHALLKMWGRAVTVCLTVAFLVYLGAGMRGNLFAPGGEDAFARLGYAADLGTGSFITLRAFLKSQDPTFRTPLAITALASWR